MYALIIPVYRNESTLPELLRRIESLADGLDGEVDVVLVVDGSPDRSAAILRALLPSMSFKSQLVCLSRNFGSFAAIRTGLSVAQGSHFAVLAADLQEPVSLVREFFRVLQEEDVDVAIGQRVSRADPLWSRVASDVFWWFYRHFVQREIPPGGVDVFACRDQVRQVLVAMPEANSSLVGLLFWVGFRRRLVPYARAARRDGGSGWTFRRKLRYVSDSVFAFSDLPIRVITWMGAIGTAGSMGLAALVLLAWTFGEVRAPGYTALMLVMLASLSMTLLALGILGSYIWRVFENTKQRPLSIIQSIDRFDPAARASSEGAV